MMRQNPLTYKAMTQEQYALWCMKNQIGNIVDSLVGVFEQVSAVFVEMAEGFSRMLDSIHPHRVVVREAIETGEHKALAEGWL